MRRKYLVPAITALMLVLAHGCATMTHEQEGQVIGGVLGGVLGAQIGDGSGRTVAIIAGTIAGSMIGRHIGQTMDDTDRMITAQALHDGQARSWRNSATGNRYAVTPTDTRYYGDQTCREFRLNATVGNTPDEEVYGTACLQPDGSWQLM